MKIIIVKEKTFLRNEDFQKTRSDLEKQVKSGVLLLDNRFEYPPIVVDNTAPSESIEALHEQLKNSLTAQEYIELLESMIKTIDKIGAFADDKSNTTSS